MKLAKLDSMVAQHEGKKVPVSMGNCREVRKVIDELIKSDAEVAQRYLDLATKALKKLAPKSDTL